MDRPEQRAVEHRAAPDGMDDAVRAAIARHAGPFSQHLVTHWELVVETIDPDGDPDAAPQRLRWCPKRSSPHLSFGLLGAAVARLKRQLEGSA